MEGGGGRSGEGEDVRRAWWIVPPQGPALGAVVGCSGSGFAVAFVVQRRDPSVGHVPGDETRDLRCVDGHRGHHAEGRARGW